MCSHPYHFQSDNMRKLTQLKSKGEAYGGDSRKHGSKSNDLQMGLIADVSS